MKKQATQLLGAIALLTSAQAGDTYVESSSKGVMMPPPPPACGWNWFAGGSVGTLLDFEEEMYTLHFGSEYGCQGGLDTHALFLEVGYTEGDFGFNPQTVGTAIPFADIDGDIIPVTLNYKYERNLGGAFNIYAGAGAGVAFVDVDASFGGPSTSFDDTVFYGHVFAGVTYNFNPSFELYAGARYIFMDDPDLTGSGILDEAFSLDGDVLIELGARYNF